MTRRRMTIALVLAGVTLTVSATACGGESSSSSDETTTAATTVAATFTRMGPAQRRPCSKSTPAAEGRPLRSYVTVKVPFMPLAACGSHW